MEKLKLSVVANEISITEHKSIVSGTHGDTMSVTFSDGWDEYLIRAVWQYQLTEPFETVANADGTYNIPAEVIKQSGYFKVGFYGTKGDAITPTVWSEQIPILKGVPTSLEFEEPYPTLYEKLAREKQDKLVAGDGIKIEDNVISATGSNGDGLTQEMKTALNELLKLCAFTSDPSKEYNAFKTAFGITDGGDQPTPDPNPEPSDDPPIATDFRKWLSFDSSIVQNADSIVITSTEEAYGKYVVAGLFKYKFSEIKTKGFTLNLTIESSDMVGTLYGYSVSASSNAPTDYSDFINKTIHLHATSAGTQNINIDYNYPDWQPSTPSDDDYIFLRLEYAGTGTITIKNFSISEW